VRIGVDLGGTKIEAAAMAADGALLARRRLPTPGGDYEATLASVERLVTGLEGSLRGESRVGIATPGSLSPVSGRIRNANSVCLNGRALDKDLERTLQRPVRIANDADCFALSEAVDGAGTGARCVFGVILGTGTGGGIVIEGRLLNGPNRIAGEWGHNPLPWPDPDELPGPPCYCGRRGCIETFLSGPGLALDHRRVSGREMSPAQIAAGAAAGDPMCSASLRRYEDRLARALAGVINILDPDVVVLGGGLSKLRRLYENVPSLLARYLFSDCLRTRLLAPVHGDSSGVRGAAWLQPP
jgi:fructokinase